MIDITCKCICCGKTWKMKIDEHDYERYRIGKQFPPPTSEVCNCRGPEVKDYDPPVIDTVCEICGEVA